MDITYRYTPLTKRLGFEEFGDKFFRNLDEIDYEDKKVYREDRIYPMAWDNYQDRDLVWLTDEKMIHDFIEGQKSHCVNNPVNIIDLESNIKSLRDSLHYVMYKDDVKYYQHYVDMGYKYFIFIGKNRITLPLYRIWKGIKENNPDFNIFKFNDEEGNYIYNVEYKLFTKNMDSKWKGEFYRGEKTIFPDSPMMLKISYDCHINKFIYKWCESHSNRKLFSPTWNEKKFILAKPKEFIDECMWYVKENTFIGISHSEFNDKDINRWKNNEKIPSGFNSSWKKFEEYYKYILKYSGGAKDFIKEWTTESKLRLVFKLIHDIKSLNYIPKDKNKGWNIVFDRFFEFVSRELLSTTKYGFTTKTELDFKNLLMGIKVSGDIYTQRPNNTEEKRKFTTNKQQHEVLFDVISQKFLQPLLRDGTLVEVEQRAGIPTDEKYGIFFDNDMLIRINGQKKDTGEWFNSSDKTLYKKVTLKEFVRMERNLDHVLSLKSGKGNNDKDNLEWTTKEYNSWKAEDDIVE